MENVTSFRFYLAADTLAFSYVLPTTGRTPDLHQLETCCFLFSYFCVLLFFCFLSSLC